MTALTLCAQFAGYAPSMKRARIIAPRILTLADRATPAALKLIAAANILFLAAFLIALYAANGLAQ